MSLINNAKNDLDMDRYRWYSIPRAYDSVNRVYS